MSPMLQRETILHMNSKFRKDVPFLAEADTLFVGCVLERMIVIVCVQQEYILVEGEAIEIKGTPRALCQGLYREWKERP